MNRRDLFKAVAGAAAASVLPASSKAQESPGDDGPICTRITCKRITPYLWDLTINFSDCGFYQYRTKTTPKPRDLMRMVGKPASEFVPLFQ